MPYQALPMPNSHFTAADMGSPDYAAAISRGLSLGLQPSKQAHELLSMMLKNKTEGAKAKYAEEMEQATLKEKIANAMRTNQLASQPFGGMLSGVGKEVYGLELLKQKFGEDHAIYETAKKAYDPKLKALEGLTNYRQGLAETSEARSLSPLGKLAHEEDLLAGSESGSIDPQRQQELLGQYKLARQKNVTDADTRKKTLLATNIDKTLELINPKDLTQFAGLGGAIKLKQEQAKALSNPGSESKEYRKYKDAENKANFLAHQVRQFYGDSIQPAMLNKLEQITNPATWKNNPDIALKLFNSFKNLLKQETDTYRSGLKNTKIYQGEKSSATFNAFDNPGDNNNTYTEQDIINEAEYFNTTPDVIKAAIATGIKTEDELRDWIQGLQK